MNQNEAEIKLRLSSLEKAEAQMRQINAVLEKPRYLEDNLIFDTEDLELRQSGNLLRIRLIDSHGVITFKGPAVIEEGIRQREEIEAEFDQPEALLQIFQRLGYKIVFRYQKYRAVYSISSENLEICIDQTPIGLFYELEGDTHSIHKVAKQLGYSKEDYITDSYAALYFQWCRENSRQPSFMIFS